MLLVAMAVLTSASTRANVRCNRMTTCEECAGAPLPCEWCVFGILLGWRALRDIFEITG